MLSQVLIPPNRTMFNIVALVILISTSAFSQSNDSIAHRNTGFLDFNGYYDTREFSVMTLNALANLPNRFQYFSLTNYEGPKKTSDLGLYYTEQNIRWKLNKSKPLDVTLQWVNKSGLGNDGVKLGIRWKLNKTTKLESLFKKLNLSYSLNFHLIQFKEHKTPDYLPQLEHVYRINLFPQLMKNKLYVSGFADQNISYDESDNRLFKWVSEHQIGYKIANSFFAVIEYRINDFMASDNYGLGYGFEYKINFK